MTPINLMTVCDNMTPLIANNTRDIAKLCERFRVARLELFGSAATDQFQEETSDVDFLVQFGSDSSSNWDDYFGLKFAFEELFHRSVDLVEESAVENPYFWRSIERTRQVIYAA